MLVRLADLNIRIENRYPFLEEMVRAYTVQDALPHLTIETSNTEILKEDAGRTHPGYAESLAVYRKIAEEIILFDGFLMHGAVLETDGQGVAFLAKSGVGKTTHMALWKKQFGARVQVVNGDKPLVRFMDGVPYVYGTPWAGKEGLQRNVRVPLKAICFLSRGEKNEAFPCRKEDVLTALLPQIYMPKDGAKVGTLLETVGHLMETVSFYSIRCTPDIEAASVAYEAIFN